MPTSTLASAAAHTADAPSDYRLGDDPHSPRARARATRAAKARKVSGRRRLVDPATCEKDYSESELEFMQAIDSYRRASGRMFPTWSEVLEVVQALGYNKAGV